MFRRLTVALCALGVAWACPAFAGTWSFSFPPNYCYKVNSPNTLATLSEGQPYVSFPQTSPTSTGIECDVPYPYGLSANSIAVDLTYQSGETDVSKKVGWRAWWLIVRSGQAWETVMAYTQATGASNTACLASGSGADLDTHCTVDISAYYLDALSTKTLCTDVACRGNHGELQIARLSSTLVTSDSANPVKLTRINLTAPTP